MRAAIVVALVSIACRAAPEQAKAKEPAATIVDLTTSAAPLRAAFDAHRGEPRFIALLSPT